MKKRITILAAFLSASLSLMAADTTKAAAPAKNNLGILTVDVSEVYNNYRKAQESQEKFATSVDAAQEEIMSMVQDGQKLVESYQELEAKANNPALTEDARKKFMEEAKKKEDEIRKKEISVNQFRQQTDMNLNQRRQSLLNLHLSEIKDAVTKIAKKRSAEIVFNASGMGIMYANSSYDITAEVISALNENPPSSAK
ncbi:MAG: hypothetical protein COZ46_06065 [Verrucomicrobia bacterium CG_4_10_14_3_um_filter_43_23]|nr:MAG: hypothetical protein AUJ82_03820 [Verrucomicrobia bacterium CG1_02_43_26]PIP59337.1 MAG: hypothetical protein COX01_04000 [Verrucomicrobia bacterium CG22_combo_CG10-13_8_21_14_all_43_17]PIX57962.1 MAG: hypothetical protein COZ46_06065 [Verrucomicrobia bacterium CG_4_10_14_3_um_filter_43_23]PIY62836.1 MAG: hypothetical protein COY94_01020 [Verrucomicrobia bacterium CG_4_10_14_0_8_um_filter_43_34]PJA44711.1 MAG: hypothetical protein CO175_01495 [Verrucomicrobia bacterium CG_4_9_14_3_um_fi